MKPLRVLYLVLLLVSLTLSFVLYYRYQLKDKELSQYRELSRYAGQVLKQVSGRLAQNKKNLQESWKQIEKLNETIAALELDNLSFKGELQALKTEREDLQMRIARLIEKKTILEKRFSSLSAKFRSLEELERAMKIAKITERGQRTKSRSARIEMLKTLDEIALRQGNKGYLLRQGSSTFKPRITVELEPVSRWSYR